MVKIVSRFSQLINAALFCAAFPRRVKHAPQSRDKKARPRLYAKSIHRRKTRRPSPSTSPTPPGVLPAGARQGGLILHAPPCLPFPTSHIYSSVPPPVFSTSTVNFTPAFLAPQLSAIKAPFSQRRKKPRHPALCKRRIFCLVFKHRGNSS
jgi:hypothetical protein